MLLSNSNSLMQKMAVRFLELSQSNLNMKKDLVIE